jgi:hypothetical protein
MGVLTVPGDSLWWLVAPIAVWTVHFGGVYGLVALGCPRWAEGAVHMGVAGVTVVALGLLGALIGRGVRRYVHGKRTGAGSRTFLALVVALISGAGLLGVLYDAASVVLVGGCS